ncbi:YceI family protein [Sulfurospirillum arcachonense]|uniref:YceI family protein n=1 Tax=Sulfurospirillum arcachonense TaxID=57666 RepID=UPI0004685CD4|nr:YceI family protein [Sulfurospirillum arcachonense]
MYRIVIFVLVTCLWANASDLTLQKGNISAHTEIFGDSNINPSTKEIHSKLMIDANIESLRGKIFIDTLSLNSDKKDRDEHMYELLNTQLHKTISYEIKEISKIKDDYQIAGVLTLNGVQKDVLSIASIKQDSNNLSLEGNFSIQLTQYDMTPPTLLFLTVRDQIDITYNLTYKKVNK